MQKFAPFLWFDDQAEDAVKLRFLPLGTRDSAAYRAHGAHDQDELAGPDDQRISGRGDAKDYVTRLKAGKCPP